MSKINRRIYREVILAIGIILISIRLFFPVNEYFIMDDGIRLKPDTFKPDHITAFEKTVIISKTIFHVVGIAILTGGLYYFFTPRKKDKNISTREDK